MKDGHKHFVIGEARRGKLIMPCGSGKSRTATKRAMEYDPPILSDYKIISIAVSREEVAELIRKNTFVRPATEHS